MPVLTFHSHSCFELQTNDYRILIDPFFSGNPLARKSAEDFEKLDAIIVTHGHGDHIGDTEAIAKRTGALVISNFEIAGWFEARGITAHPMHIGGGRKFNFGHLQMTIAHHGSTGPEGEALGNPMGVVLTIEGKKIYHAGDTGVFMDMQLIGDHYGPLDLALLPIGDNFTMGIRDAVKACDFLCPRLAIPMHYNTFPPIAAEPQNFVRRAEANGHRAVEMAIGESREF